VAGVTVHQGFHRDYYLSNDSIDKFTEKTLLLSTPPIRVGVQVVDIDGEKIGKVKKLHRHADTNELEFIEIPAGLIHKKMIPKSDIWGVGEKIILNFTKKEFNKLE
jgi:sporulation protein YlmC with PRC-barrel domain